MVDCSFPNQYVFLHQADTHSQLLYVLDIILLIIIVSVNSIQIPKITREEIHSWRHLQFTSLAVKVMSKFIGQDEIPSAQLESIINKSYSTFSTSHVTPLVKISDDGTYILEQFHGG